MNVDNILLCLRNILRNDFLSLGRLMLRRPAGGAARRPD